MWEVSDIFVSKCFFEGIVAVTGTGDCIPYCHYCQQRRHTIFISLDSSDLAPSNF